jgi:Fe-S-cluster containining protein
MFKCDKCGECCRNIGNSKELKKFDRGDGVCKYLDEKTNLCKIYNNRPEICRVDLMYEKYYKKFYSKEEFYELNYKACEILKQKKRR